MKRTILALFVLFAVLAMVPARAGNWSFWRGPTENGVSPETGLPDKFTFDGKGGTNVVFATPRGSLGTPIVQDCQVYILSKSGEGLTQQECVVAFDASTGKQVWEHKFNVWHTDIVEDRLAFTNLVGDPETGNVYAHLTAGQFLCFDKAGKILWQHSMTEEYGRVSGYGGRVTSPIVYQDKVILSMISGSWGEQTVGGTRFVAFDKKTGNVIWWGWGYARVKDTYYSVPIVADIAGQALVIGGGGDGHVHAFKVGTGERVWSYKLEDGGGAVNCSPVVQGDRVYIGHGEENVGNGTQGRIICLDAGKLDKEGKPTLVWKYDGVKVKFASPILHEGLLCVCDDAGKLFCFDADKGGEPIWEFNYGRNTKGSPVLADGKIYVSEVDSQFHILKFNKTDEPTRLSRVRFPANGVVPTELHGSPAVANGKVYFTTTSHLICIGLPGAKETPVVKESAPAKVTDETPAHLQVYPADVTIQPGEKVDFKAFTYNKAGQKIGEAKVEWELGGMLPPAFPPGLTAPKPSGPAPAIQGTLTGNGAQASFTAARMPPAQFGRIVAKSGELVGYARIRVAPTLPYAMDFEKVPVGRTPAAWVNTMAKFAVVKGPDGSLVLRKRNDNASPLVARANAYISDPSLKDYTIEADVQGTRVRDKDMPDIGVGAMRYTLFLIGNDQEARIVTWDAQKRIEKKLPYKWKPGVWYRMKLTASVADGKGLVKGKIWPRDEKEPEAWTLEAEDPIPNTEGAALLYGFANGTIDAKFPGAEIFYDNVKITPNKK